MTFVKDLKKCYILNGKAYRKYNEEALSKYKPHAFT